MYRIQRHEDPEKCARLWQELMPRDCLFDLWPVRECFAGPFDRRPCFITAEDAGGRIQGLLALSWIEKERSFGHFPGETWQGKTWLEQNRIIARRQGVVDQLVENVPGEAYLRYLVGELPLPEGLCAEPDETGYLFFPAECRYAFDRFMQRFSGKTRKKLRHELSPLESTGVSYRYNDLSDVDALFRMNLEGFGDRSYFYDPRFLKSFENLVEWLHNHGLLRVTTVTIGGRTAAVDIGAVWADTYTVLAGGVDPEFPGVAKLINFHHIRRACETRVKTVDFLCGDFGWKQRFHLTPRTLYKIRIPARTEKISRVSLN